MTDIKNLLNKLECIEIKTKQPPFSTLNLMYQRVREKERIHSEILAGFFNPNENHGLGKLPLKLFLEMAFPNKINFKNININTIAITVERSVKISEMANTRFIDIVIEWKDLCEKKKAIIIENKLNYAVDQENQINDYHDSLFLSNYEIVGVVYMPVSSKYKMAKHTGTTKEILEKTVDFDASKLIEWLSEIQKRDKDLNEIIQYKLFLQCLQDENNNKNNAMKIIEKLSPEEITKLENIAKLVSSEEWCEARFSDISTKLKMDALTVSYKKYKDNRNYAQYFFEFNDEFWIELWLNENDIDLYLVSKLKEVRGVTIGDVKFEYSSWEKYFYYKSIGNFKYHNARPTDGKLIDIAKKLLWELKEKRIIIA